MQLAALQAEAVARQVEGDQLAQPAVERLVGAHAAGFDSGRSIRQLAFAEDRFVVHVQSRCAHLLDRLGGLSWETPTGCGAHGGEFVTCRSLRRPGAGALGLSSQRGNARHNTLVADAVLSICSIADVIIVISNANNAMSFLRNLKPVGVTAYWMEQPWMAEMVR